MPKSFYAVKRGFNKETNKEVTDIISRNWAEIKSLVIGYDNARYKGFNSEEEAKVWLSVVDKTDAEKRAKQTIEKAKEELGIECNTKVNDELRLSIDIEDIKVLKKKGYSKHEIFYNFVESIRDVLEKAYDPSLEIPF